MKWIINWHQRHKECIHRSVRTFFQAAAGVFVTGIASGEFDWAEWKTWIVTLGGSALAAGVAALMNRNGTEEVEE